MRMGLPFRDLSPRQKRRRILLIGLLAIVAGLFFMPLRVAVGLGGLSSGLSARAVEGTIWQGRVHDLRAGRVPLGTLDARLKLLPLFVGKAQLSLFRDADALAPSFSGDVAGGMGLVSLTEANGTVVLSSAFEELPLTAAELTDVNARFSSGKCVSASGTVRLLLAPIDGISLSNGMTGTPKCRGDDLLLPLFGQSGLERLDVTITSEGKFQAVLTVDQIESDMEDVFSLGGFDVSDGSARIVASGQL